MSAKYPYRRKPFTGLAAFHHSGVDTAPSQAAHLLHMGNQLRQSDEALVARAKTQRRKGFVQPAAMEELDVPVLTPNARLVPREESQVRLSKLHGYALRATPGAAGNESAFEAAFQKTAARVFMQPVAAHAADLFAMGLEHPHALVRIAAAISGLRLSTQPQHCVRELVKGLKSADALERTLAATGLARHHPEHPALRALARGRSAKLRKKPPETLMLVHGTFASDSPWYQPGGDFFSLDLMGRSHGGNIMFKAAEMGLKLGKLVVLSCPVHVDKYFPDFNNLKVPVVSVRVLETLTMLDAWCLWRPWGWTAPGAALARTLAAVLLVRGGEHAVRPLQRNLAGGHALAMSLRVLGDVGGCAALNAITPFSHHPDVTVARAAADALRAASLRH